MRNSSVSDAHTIKIKNKHILQNIPGTNLSSIYVMMLP
jgi:hypothetical protein